MSRIGHSLASLKNLNRCNYLQCYHCLLKSWLFYVSMIHAIMEPHLKNVLLNRDENNPFLQCYIILLFSRFFNLLFVRASCHWISIVSQLFSLQHKLCKVKLFRQPQGSLSQVQTQTWHLCCHSFYLRSKWRRRIPSQSLFRKIFFDWLDSGNRGVT